MGLKGKLIAEYEARSSGDLFHDLMINRPHHIANIAPSQIQGCGIHEGEFGKNGSVIIWNYTNNGKACISKQVVENVTSDGANKTLSLREIEGDLTKLYKTFESHLHVKTGDITIINWTLDYEKLHDDAPPPTTMLDMILSASAKMEEHHLKA